MLNAKAIEEECVVRYKFGPLMYENLTWRKDFEWIYWKHVIAAAWYTFHALADWWPETGSDRDKKECSALVVSAPFYSM